MKTPDCYGQIDLYGDDITYDGKTGEGHGPVPYGDNVVTPYHLIAAWNGGERHAAQPVGLVHPDAAVGVDPDRSPTPVTPTTPAGGQPPRRRRPQASDQFQALHHASHHAGRAPAGIDAARHPEPSPSDSGPPLAETGASAPVGTLAGGAALVVALGAGAVFASRRARRS